MKKAIAFAALVVVGAGCPGELKDPSEFLVSCPAGYNVDTQLFGPTGTCSGVNCHNPMQAVADNLDLVSPGVANRIIGVTSTVCSGKVLIVNADAGYMFEKLTQNPPQCGIQMPFGKTPLDANTIQCLRNWVGAQMADGGP
jgi:predicted CxxxxCH...CXXCH cytochrome family protein